MNIPTNVWPARSPDLNPIENCWGYLTRIIYADGRQYSTVEELKTAIASAWANMPQEYIRTLIASMPNRVNKVIEQRGEHIGY